MTSRLTLSAAARTWGKSRQTLYTDVKAGRMSIGRDERGAVYVDASEMVRAYGEPSARRESPVDATEQAQDVTAEDVEPMRIAFAHQHCRRVQRHSGGESKPPQVQTHADDQGERPVENRKGPRRSAHENRLSEGNMKWDFVAFDFFRSSHGLTTRRRRRNRRTLRRSWWPSPRWRRPGADPGCAATRRLH